MNTPKTALAPEPESPSIQTLDLAALSNNPRPTRPKGKIASLPKEQRQLINQLLDEGATYKAIADHMANQGVCHLSNWFNSGYQQHVRQCEWRDEMRSLREAASDLTEPGDDTAQFQQTLLQLGLMEIFRTLKQGQLQPDSPNYFRLFSSLARLSREALAWRKYTDNAVKEQARQRQAADPERNLDSEVMVRILERGLGIKAAPGPIGPDLNELFKQSNNQSPVGSHPIPHMALFESEPDQDQPKATPTMPPATTHIVPEDSHPLNPDCSHSSSTDTVSVPVNEPSSIDSTVPISSPNQPNSGTPPAVSESQPLSDSRAQVQHPTEHCLECCAPLPPLRPDGSRPGAFCPNCSFELPPPGTCIEPGTEQCQYCHANLPRLLASGERPSNYCHHCSTPLPPPGHDQKA